MSKPGDGLAALVIGDSDGREAKLGFARKLMLALKKDDEHAVADALEDFLAECDDAGGSDSDEEG